MDAFGGNGSGGEGGGFGNTILPLAAFAAGFIAPERTSQAVRGWAALQQQQLQQREAVENRAFREKQFAAQERERADIGQTRSQERDVRAQQLAQLRAQQQAGQLLPNLQFSKDVSVNQPDIPGRPATVADVPLADDFDVNQPSMPGFQVKGQVPQTIDELRKQIFSFNDATPDVRSELFEKVLRSGAPMVPPKEPEEVQRARHAVAAEQFLGPQVGAVPARRMSELIRTGAATLPPDVLSKAISGDVRPVDTGEYIVFWDVARNQRVAAIQKSPTPQVQVVDDPSTQKKTILFMNPRTKQVDALPTDIPIGGVVDANFARFMSLRAQDQVTPDMPPRLTQIPPEMAAEILKQLGVSAGGRNPIDEIIAERLRDKKPPAAPPAPAPKGAQPIPAPKGSQAPAAKEAELEYDPATGRAVPKKR